jgi:hypothetical protein
MQQSDKQIRNRYKNLFGKPIELNGKPTIYQRRGFIQKSFKQTDELFQKITNFDYSKANYIKSMQLAEVYKILDNFLEPKK